MKRFRKCIAALSAIAVIGVVFAGLIAPLMGGGEVPQAEAFKPGEKPAGEKLDLVMPDATDEVAVKAFAAELYAIASEKYCTAENVAYQTSYTNTMLGVPVAGYRFNVRNQDREHYTEYAFISGDTNNPTIKMLSAIMGAIAGDSTRFAEARYTDDTMDNYQSYKYVAPDQNSQPTPTIDEAGYPSFDIPWGEGKMGELAKHDYGYRLTDHDVLAETILSAEVSYNEEEGYYTLKLKLDLEKAPEKITLPNLKASSGMDNAHYTKLDQTIEIWDNGYPRYFLAEDTWMGSIESELVFSTTYYFDEYWTDIANYQYMSDYCKILD
ncbi:MAG: hypothetical protein J6R44_04795 [Clostridia bacterium]|nr:hypothetical protein [Clostridia bacterium]